MMPSKDWVLFICILSGLTECDSHCQAVTAGTFHATSIQTLSLPQAAPGCQNRCPSAVFAEVVLERLGEGGAPIAFRFHPAGEEAEHGRLLAPRLGLGLRAAPGPPVAATLWRPPRASAASRRPIRRPGLRSTARWPSCGGFAHPRRNARPATDRKSTRLNSSHLGISYAVFCLQKK